MDEPKITLANGVNLYPDRRMAKHLQDYATRKGFASLRVFVAEQPGGHESYLLVDGEDPVFESQSAEAIAVHIDMMWVDIVVP